MAIELILDKSQVTFHPGTPNLILPIWSRSLMFRPHKVSVVLKDRDQYHPHKAKRDYCEVAIIDNQVTVTKGTPSDNDKYLIEAMQIDVDTSIQRQAKFKKELIEFKEKQNAL